MSSPLRIGSFMPTIKENVMISEYFIRESYLSSKRHKTMAVIKILVQMAM